MRAARRVFLAATAATSALMLAGCLSVEVRTPEPIQIDLNVNIRQEVVYRLEGEAQNLLDARPDIF